MADDGQGWHGDSEGHSEAAKGNSGGTQSNSDDSSNQGQGWHGDSEGHAEAAKEGQSEDLMDKVKDVFTDGDNNSDGEGKGWHGDSEGHSEAAKSDD